jgi:hypothetical protein
MPDQATALTELFRLEGAVALDIAGEEHMSLRVAVYFASVESEEDAPPASARWFSISVAGTVREICPDPVAS